MVLQLLYVINSAAPDTSSGIGSGRERGPRSRAAAPAHNPGAQVDRRPHPFKTHVLQTPPLAYWLSSGGVHQALKQVEEQLEKFLAVLRATTQPVALHACFLALSEASSWAKTRPAVCCGPNSGSRQKLLDLCCKAALLATAQRAACNRVSPSVRLKDNTVRVLAAAHEAVPPELQHNCLVGERRSDGVHGCTESRNHEEALQHAVHVARVA